ncbi:hypothetical protein [Actinomadura madurae]|uniref:hypothetical protein n=1 Tax=Actinomadura madurae TaxID=1993 RepID=UPI0020D2368C|nr:hypothetical protein [Actinomadura madurae]MCP9964869.1 hypothetical protein [Actinomadura madurae]MCQ0013538.1 hypothetical protein [Actinomadura madurae]
MTDQGGTGLRHAPAGESESRLARNRLGVAGIVFFVVAAAAPLVGMTGAVPIAIVLGNGAGVPGAYLAAGIVLLVFSVGYSAMSHRVTNTGAFFAYVGRGLGVVPGVGSAFVSLLAYVAVQLAVFGFFGAVMAARWTPSSASRWPGGCGRSSPGPWCSACPRSAWTSEPRSWAC